MTQAELAQGAIDTTLHDPRAVTRSRSKFYFGMAVAMSAAVFVGFGPSFYVNPYFGEVLGLPPLQTLSSIIIVHGLVFTTWMILLMIQTGLVAGGQVRWHRRLGIAGAVLAAAVVTLGTAVNIASTQRDIGALDSVPFVRIAVFGGFTSLIAFAGLAGAAIAWRRRPEIHKRLILIATIALLGAATGRIGRTIGFAVPAVGPLLPFLGLVLTDLFLVALLVHDWRTNKRPHAATLYGGLLILAMQVLSNSPLPHSAAVVQFEKWLAG